MQAMRGVSGWSVACLAAVLAAGPTSLARAEVISLTVGVNPGCPYGLAA